MEKESIYIARTMNTCHNGRLVVALLFAASALLWLYRGGDSFMVCALLMAGVPGLAILADMFDEESTACFAFWLAAHVLPAVVFLFLLAKVIF